MKVKSHAYVSQLVMFLNKEAILGRVHACDPSILEAEAGGMLGVPSQSELQS